MKNIADIYNENAEIVATPANTTGMGNPMAPTDTENGSEPLVAKCKKDNKKKCKKYVKEGLLKGQAETLKGGDDIIKFVQWFVNQHVAEEPVVDFEAAFNSMMNATELKGDTVIINTDKAYDHMIKRFDPDRLIIKTALMPSNIKNIKIINCKHGYIINSYISDLSQFNIEVYTDNGNKYGNIVAAFKMKTTGDAVKFGNIKAGAFTVSSPKIKTIEIGKDCDIIEPDFEQCMQLEDIKGSLGMPEEFSVSRHFLKCQLVKSGLLGSMDTNLRIFN